jgi:hypothetical protein
MLTFSSSSEEEYPDGIVGGRWWAFSTPSFRVRWTSKRGRMLYSSFSCQQGAEG